jgi:hypothetical protein
VEKKMTDEFELESPEAKPKKKIAKPKYTEQFEKWWEAYPRKTAKFKAFQSWQSHVDESDTALVVIADTEKRNRMRFWAADKSKIPMPTTFLNQHRWEDEWEDEVKTRGRETIATHTKHSEANRAPHVDTGHGKGHWMSMLHRLGLNYMIVAGTLTDAVVKQLVREKNRLFEETMGAVKEEIETATDKKQASTEMAWMLADTMLSRFDAITGRNLKNKIINMSRRPT